MVGGGGCCVAVLADGAKEDWVVNGLGLGASPLEKFLSSLGVVVEGVAENYWFGAVAATENLTLSLVWDIRCLWSCRAFL